MKEVYELEFKDFSDNMEREATEKRCQLILRKICLI